LVVIFPPIEISDYVPAAIAVLISSPLSPSQKECETNHNRVQKNAAVFANRNSWRKVTITHSHKSSWWAQQIHVTKEKMATLNLIKVLYAGPKSTRNILTNLSPSPDRPETGLDPTCNSIPTTHRLPHSTWRWDHPIRSKPIVAG